jgi:hypothetical protein
MLAIRSATISGRSSLRVPARSLRASAHHGAMNHTSAILWAWRSSLFLLCGSSLSSSEKAETPSVARSAGRPLSQSPSSARRCVSFACRICVCWGACGGAGMSTSVATVSLWRILWVRTCRCRRARREARRGQVRDRYGGNVVARPCTVRGSRGIGRRRPQGDGRPRRSPPAPPARARDR